MANTKKTTTKKTRKPRAKKVEEPKVEEVKIEEVKVEEVKVEEPKPERIMKCVECGHEFNPPLRPCPKCNGRIIRSRVNK
tara:strand:+ start:440 stop:679 length:240 start_codon:yes stop_codon:yes gene_type:complete